jgi:16S rRNA (cytidine1402-2'-O)-methyltransferase
LAAHYAAAGAPKGEIVVIVAPPLPKAEVSDEALDAFLRRALDRGVKAAASEAARELGVPRKRAYARALELKDQA